MADTLLDRLWSYVDRQGPADCWPWTGATNASGYGIICQGGKSLLAHRALYMAVVGPIPERHVLHHECERPTCLNPAHLTPLTRREHKHRHPAIRPDIVPGMAATSDRNDHTSVLVRFYGKDAALLPRIDKARGDLSRNAYIVGVLAAAVKPPARRSAVRPAGTAGGTNGKGKAKAAPAKREVQPRFKTGRGAKG